MRILIVGQYFPPEITAGAARMYGFASALARRGHDVEVICEVPSHPEGVVAPGYGGAMVDRREVDGFEVSYVWVRATASKGTTSRLVNYGSFALSAAVAGMRCDPDVIFASSPPLTTAAAAAALARRHRVPWVFDVRDLWPDVAVVVEQVSEGPLVRAARRIERRLYRSAAAITATTTHFASEIERRGARGEVTLLRNGASEAALAAGAAPLDRSGLPSGQRRFRWLYAGNLGLAQGLDTAVEAASMLGDEFRLVLLGEGPERARLQRLSASLAPDSVEFARPQPSDQAARTMRAADALLVPLAATPGLEGFVPSKLFDCCAVGRPIVVATGGETDAIVRDAEVGLSVPPGDAQRLAEAVRTLRDDPAAAERLAANARAFGERNSRERGGARLESVLLSVVG